MLSFSRGSLKSKSLTTNLQLILSVIWSVAVTLTCSGSYAHALPNFEPVPGGLIQIQLNAISEDMPNVTFQDKAVLTIKQEGYWQALVGLPLSLKPGQYQIISNEQPVEFEVIDKSYPEQHIKLKTNKHVELSDANFKRHKKEKEKAHHAFAHFEKAWQPDLDFIKPVKGRYSSAFGLKRFYNGKPRNPHSGVDIAAAKGTTIVAASSGKVVLTGNFFFNGNVVYIDHGQGVISMYCHMDSISVEKGQWLEKGEPVGAVGATGRVTGAHLHWSLSFNDVRIDPKILLSSKNRK